MSTAKETQKQKKEESVNQRTAPSTTGTVTGLTEEQEEAQEQATQAGGHAVQSDGAAVSEEEAENTDYASSFTNDKVEDQEAREEAGPFTGTGNQDAMRTHGRTGSSDAHHADQRVSGDESAVEDKDDKKKK
jgi:hypothetical protein